MINWVDTPETSSFKLSDEIEVEIYLGEGGYNIWINNTLSGGGYTMEEAKEKVPNLLCKCVLSLQEIALKNTHLLHEIGDKS